MRANAQTAWDTSGPAITAPTKAEQAYALKKLQRGAKVGHMSQPVGDVFSQPITTRAQADRTNSIRGKL
jgi:hypothetical protein